MKESLHLKLEKLLERQEELEGLLADPETINNQNKFKELYPIAKNQDVIGGLHIPEDGQADPQILTQTISIAAKNAGVKIIENCKLE